jgi:hypothetical protein
MIPKNETVYTGFTRVLHFSPTLINMIVWIYEINFFFHLTYAQTPFQVSLTEETNTFLCIPPKLIYCERTFDI